MLAPEDGEAAEAPPGVAHVGQLFRAAVEAAAGGLALAEPPAKEVAVGDVERAGERERADAGEDLAGVRLVAFFVVCFVLFCVSLEGGTVRE